MKNAIRFNTNRSYTKHGQRIAAVAMDGGVFMVDADRGLYYFFPGCSLTKGAVMDHYDNMNRDNYPPSIVRNGYKGFNELRDALDAFARAIDEDQEHGLTPEQEFQD